MWYKAFITLWTNIADDTLIFPLKTWDWPFMLIVCIGGDCLHAFEALFLSLSGYCPASVHKQFLVIASPPRPLVRFFETCLGCSSKWPSFAYKNCTPEFGSGQSKYGRHSHFRFFLLSRLLNNQQRNFIETAFGFLLIPRCLLRKRFQSVD